MRRGWIKRAVVWAAVMESARANRAKYPTLPTAWLPHALGNTALLGAPEWLSVVDRALASLPAASRSAGWQGVRRALHRICTDNPDWAQYVMPMAFGYVLSHPRFNIYQGEMGSLRVMGLGLDAIPHSMTAYAVTRLAYDGLYTLRATIPSPSALASVVQRLVDRRALVGIAILLTLTAIWELGEYTMQQEELRRMGGDYEAINMQWDVPDALADLAANMLGWVVATWQPSEAIGDGVVGE